MEFWSFLTIAVIFGVLLAMFAVYLDYRKSIKRLEVEALKYQSEAMQAESGIVMPKKLESRVEALEATFEEQQEGLKISRI